MDMTSLATAFEAAKATLGIAKAAASAAVDHQMKDRLIEIQQGILDVQAQLADATEERLDLLHQVAELRRKVGEFEAAKAALDGYELCRLEGGQYLYWARAEAGHTVEHYACPSCHNAGKVSVLQSRKTGKEQTMYKCVAPGCGYSTYVGPSDPKGPAVVDGRIRGSMFPKRW